MRSSYFLHKYAAARCSLCPAEAVRGSTDVRAVTRLAELTAFLRHPHEAHPDHLWNDCVSPRALASALHAAFAPVADGGEVGGRGHLIVVEHVRWHEWLPLTLLLHRLLEPGVCSGSCVPASPSSPVAVSEFASPGATLILGFSRLTDVEESESKLQRFVEDTRRIHERESGAPNPDWFSDKVALSLRPEIDFHQHPPPRPPGPSTSNRRRPVTACPWCCDRAIPTSTLISAHEARLQLEAEPVGVVCPGRSCDAIALPAYGGADVETVSYNVAHIVSSLAQHRRQCMVDDHPSAAYIRGQLHVSVVSPNVGFRRNLQALFGADPMLTLQHVLVK